MMATGRLLLIAPLEHDTRKQDMRYDYAKFLNELAAELVKLHGTDHLNIIYC